MSEKPNQQIPSSWALAKLDALGIWKGGGTPSKSNRQFWSHGVVPWVSSKDMKTFEIFETEDRISEAAVKSSATSWIPSGSVLIVMRSGILRHSLPVAIARVPLTINQDLKALQLEIGLEPRFVAYALRAASQKILHECVKDGTTVQSVEFDRLKHFEIPVAPTAEQSRIADTLDELLSDLDAGLQSLQTAQAKLQLYRQSVLKAAVIGSLTEKWRSGNPAVESGPELLKRILVERRRLWEEAQLQKLQTAGKNPPSNWKTKYKGPVAAAVNNLPSLPEGWCWASLDELAWNSGYGTSVKCSPNIDGLAVLRIPNIAKGALDLSNLKYAPSSYCEPQSEHVLPGDILIVRTNGSRLLIGRGAVVTEPVELETSFASYLIRFRLVPDSVLLRWVALVWGSALTRGWIESKAATSAGQFNISLNVLATLPIPLPPTSEQLELSDTQELQFTTNDYVLAYLDSKLTTIQALRQATLRSAFAGMLVSQNPTDEPAEALLDRIAAQRAEGKATKRNKPKVSKQKRKLTK